MRLPVLTSRGGLPSSNGPGLGGGGERRWICRTYGWGIDWLVSSKRGIGSGVYLRLTRELALLCLKRSLKDGDWNMLAGLELLWKVERQRTSYIPPAHSCSSYARMRKWSPSAHRPSRASPHNESNFIHPLSIQNKRRLCSLRNLWCLLCWIKKSAGSPTRKKRKGRRRSREMFRFVAQLCSQK